MLTSIIRSEAGITMRDVIFFCWRDDGFMLKFESVISR
jgi:hypothetical protein